VSSPPAPGIFQSLGRGLAKRCPRCGRGRLFEGFFKLLPACGACRLQFCRAIEDHIGLIYITTAIQTAAFAGFALVFRPLNPWLWRGILAVVALTVMLLNLPNRKGLAIAIDYLTRRGVDESNGRENQSVA
jgi:uncharacterized protein (DUF983 family)